MLEFDIGQLELKKLIDATQFSMASQDVRYYLNGMLFESEGHGLRTVATDGHRLATCRREVVTESLPDHQVILPRKGVLELVRLLEAEDKPVRLQITAATCVPPSTASSSPPSWWTTASRTGAASFRATATRP